MLEPAPRGTTSGDFAAGIFPLCRFAYPALVAASHLQSTSAVRLLECDVLVTATEFEAPCDLGQAAQPLGQDVRNGIPPDVVVSALSLLSASARSE